MRAYKDKNRGGFVDRWDSEAGVDKFLEIFLALRARKNR